MPIPRRHLLLGLATSLALPAVPARAANSPPLAAMTEGPFYPPKAWRDPWPDQDADLTRVQRGGSTGLARGEHLGLQVLVADTQGHRIDGADIEIWQCDALAAYRHPSVGLAPGSYDDNFQGFGRTRSDAQGGARLRTIKPVPYPGRTPHIHLKLRHASFGELTSQLFVAGDPGNERDGLWRRLKPAERAGLDIQLKPAAADSGLRWMAQHTLVVPA